MRPSSSALLRAPSFSSARAISYDSDGIISYESGRMTSLDSVGAESLPKPNRRTPSDDIGDVPSALLQHSRSRMQTSSSDGGKGLTPYKKLKTLTKRYTLPFHRVGRKKPPQPQ